MVPGRFQGESAESWQQARGQRPDGRVTTLFTSDSPMRLKHGLEDLLALGDGARKAFLYA